MSGSSFITIDVPGAIFTEAFGVNNAGQIVGDYMDSSGVVHGFVATAVPEPCSLALVGVGGLVSLALLGHRRRAGGTDGLPADAPGESRYRRASRP
jgi:hypothetical protein